LLVWRAYLLFLAALFTATFFRTTFFLSCHVFYSPFPFSWICGPKRKTAIDECIELLKIEVKQKIDDFFDGRRSDHDEHHHQPSFVSVFEFIQSGTNARKALWIAGKTHLPQFFIHREHVLSQQKLKNRRCGRTPW